MTPDNLREAAARRAWGALKERVCVDPEKAKRIVLLDEQDFVAAVMSALSALSVPEGWVAVPREPTREQELAMQRALLANYPEIIGGEVCTSGAMLVAIYDAALSAIPSQAPCAYCGAVRAKPCNDMLCPWAPPGDHSSWCPYTLIRQSSSPRASHTPPKATARPLSVSDAGAGDETNK